MLFVSKTYLVCGKENLLSCELTLLDELSSVLFLLERAFSTLIVSPSLAMIACVHVNYRIKPQSRTLLDL